ncbi:Anaerobic sulfatase-maturating enzyme homolog YdeM [Candidatus Ornithobacterium hominis]|uniref:Anaerobic sulfatase-maturating enzyme homolog YdeM n=1 Tax=Candidatus Ornithobacterium hominis TaxID=2497989 RepID=A0A383U3N8_9FLAO|nr:anaerobic sulfatase maturase [Candidatus Ornithobacterium hominis]MCT7904659.1 anaerobic sulfatase maturase [Candidatus Ornithobacterium hominis]SZD73999.1 Anaerobic sulfatase-maturating enzyme homolog YdeM [Candidatus Ornithobacterium hominis]
MYYKNPLSFILVKPSGPDCNLGCTYCFYLEKEAMFPGAKKHRMSDEVLEELIKQGLSQADDYVQFTWQGGEPTLMGLDFYKKVINLQQKYAKNQMIANALQTNGVLINDEWAQFLGRWNFLVGLSLDGPQHIHDKYRFTQGGKPSWEKVMAAQKKLSHWDVEMNAMCCVTNYSADFPDELYHFYKRLGMKWMQFIPIVETDKKDPSKAADFSVTPEKYGKFLKRIFDLWWNDFENGEPTTMVRNIDSVFYTYVDMPSPECTLLEQCGVYPTVEHNGDVFSCDFFVEDHWRLGNIMQGDQLIEMINSSTQMKFGKMKNILPEKCHTCEWYKNCYGGCTKDRIKDMRDEGNPRFCQSTIDFLEHSHSRLQFLAQRWKQRQLQSQQDTADIYNAGFDF